ncbi:MAG: hypothetical protein ACP5TE_00090 [Verrucomicrobiia bacterium]
MVIYTIASKQIWPQVLAVLHLKPEKVFLFHSDDEVESKKPAQHLKKFFDKSEIVPKGNTKLCPIPHDDFSKVEESFDNVQTEHQISLDSIVLNFTGGNKLMAAAAFRWAAKRSVRSFYLEKGNKIFWFNPCDGEVKTETENLDAHIADSLNPLEVLRCQLLSSVVEREGELISLSDDGMSESEEKYLKILKNGNYDPKWLKREGELIEEKKDGDHLELRTAAALLKLGICQIRRGVQLKPNTDEGVSSTMPHTEIDLLFIWNGRLWIVDCKDRMSEETLCNQFYQKIRNMSGDAKELWERIKDIVSKSHFKILKDDIVTAREVGGLYGSVICVRKSNLNEEIVQYAKRNGIYVISAKDLYGGLESVLCR